MRTYKEASLENKTKRGRSMMYPGRQPETLVITSEMSGPASCWPQTLFFSSSSCIVGSRVLSTSTVPSMLWSAWDCQSRDQPNNLCHEDLVLQTSPEHEPTHLNLSDNKLRIILGSVPDLLTIISYFHAVTYFSCHSPLARAINQQQSCHKGQLFKQAQDIHQHASLFLIVQQTTYLFSVRFLIS